MTTARFCQFSLAWMSLAFLRAAAEQGFPEWRGSNVLVPALWAQSPVVAVGEVVNVSAYGEQDVAILPPPMSSKCAQAVLVHRRIPGRGYREGRNAHDSQEIPLGLRTAGLQALVRRNGLPRSISDACLVPPRGGRLS